MALHHVGVFTAMVAVAVLLALLALLGALCGVCGLLGVLGGVGVLGAVLAAVNVLRGHCGLLRRVVGHFGAFSGKPRLHHALVIGGEGVARLIHTPAVQDRALCCQSLHVPFLLALKPTKDHSYLAGGAGEFLRVGENGELKADTPKTELLPQRQIDTFGRQFSMTRQAFINDDVGFITEMPGLYAMSAKRTINKQVYKILIDNPAIFDGVSLFDNAHNNLIASGAAPSIDTLQAAMLKLLHQKDPFGDSIMVEPKYVIVPVGYGFKLAQILETAQIDVTGIGSHTANALYQYRNKLQVIEEGALNVLAGDGNAIPWFVAGDQRYAKSLQVDYLNGQETPTIRRSEVPGRLGFVWDIWLDWGITAVDFRGITKNPGTTI